MRFSHMGINPYLSYKFTTNEPNYLQEYKHKVVFFNDGPPKEDIFSGHLLSPISQLFTHYNYKFMPWCGYCKVFLSPALCSESHISMLKLLSHHCRIMVDLRHNFMCSSCWCGFHDWSSCCLIIFIWSFAF